MKKKKTNSRQNRLVIFVVSSALVLALLSGIAGYYIGASKDGNSDPRQNTPGYITAQSAREQVNNFYTQYLNPKKEDPSGSRQAYISNYGDKNLVFYSKYYQHGFDPIVCSTTMPTSVVSTDVQAGPSAIVNAKATYPDGSSENIVLALVLNNEGFRIDSISCPGNKGNLLPQ